MTFPIDLGACQRIALNANNTTLTDEQRASLRANIQLCRDAIVFFTATGAARGVGGHTGGPYDTVPEVVIMDALFRGDADNYVPVFFDEAGHRVTTQYLMAALNGDFPAEHLMEYRAAHSHLPGHPELGLTPGVKFSSGRLGHMWPYVNGVAIANSGKVLFCLGSDGSQQEGNDAEAARFAVAKNLNVKLIIDDNDVTIAGHPSHYLPGCSVAKTLAGHGLTVLEGDGENIDDLYQRICTAIHTDGPVAVINHRPMCPGIVGLEGSNHGHDVAPVKVAVAYLESRGRQAAADHLKTITAPKNDAVFLGSSDKWDANRNVFGDAIVTIMGRMSEAERIEKIRVIDSDLEGSCGLSKIRSQNQEIALDCDMSRPRVSKWRSRFAKEGMIGLEDA
jgi:transketolase N-terminal domain/subunit